MDGLGSSFQYEESNSMLEETIEEYVSDSAETNNENPGKQAPMVFMASGRENSWIRKYIPLDGPKMFIFLLPDCHQE